MRAIPILAAAVLTLAAFARVGPSVTAQTPTPTPTVVDIPGSATLEPGTSVTFRRTSDDASLTVTHDRGVASATVRYDGTTLTIEAQGAIPVASSVQTEGMPAQRLSCIRAGETPGVAMRVTRCEVQPGVPTPRVTFTTGAEPTPPPPNPCSPPSGTQPVTTGRPIVTMTTDRTSYPAGAPVTFTLTLTNTSDEPVCTNIGYTPFPQYTVTDASNRTVWLSPETGPPHLPLQSTSHLAVGAHETRTFTTTWDRRQGRRYVFGPEGEQVPPGVYTVRGEVGFPVAESVSATFTIQGASATPTPVPTTCPGGAYCPGACPAGSRAISVSQCAPTDWERVELAAACNNVVSTFPDGSTPETVYGFITNGTTGPGNVNAI